MARALAASFDGSRLLRGCIAASAIFAAGLVSCVIPEAPGKPSQGVAAAATSGDHSPSAASSRRVRLLSQEQYLNSIGYVFGPQIIVAAHFAPFRRTQGLLEIGASSTGVTSGQIEEFQRTAAVVAEQIVRPAHRAFLIPCSPQNPTRADRRCASKFLSKVGRLLYRRPLSAALLEATVDEADRAAQRLNNFYGGLSVALEGMLISPDVVFNAEGTEPDPSNPGRLRLDAYSLASRLSLFLWNATPDDELLREAQDGQLYSATGLGKAVDRMLASPRLETGARAFFDDMFGFDDFANLSKDPSIYPAFNGVTVQDAREQTLRTVVDHLLVRRADYRDLFTTRHTFITPALATIYHVPAAPGWTPFDVPSESPRVGLLTQVSFLAAHAHPGRSSATLRGKALRELLLCETVPRPPPNVDFSLVENPNSSLRTARERITEHRKNPVCAGCHKITDPIGLALENFDGAGQYRETEKGALIDASGSLNNTQFNDAVGLAAALHDDPALTQCVVKRLYGYSEGGFGDDEARVMLPYLNERFAEEGYRFPDLMRTITLSAPFAEVSPETLPSPAPNATAQVR